MRLGHNIMSSPANIGKMIAPAVAIGRIGIIPAAMITGLVLAVAGSFYVWREISAQPITQTISVVAPPAPENVSLPAADKAKPLRNRVDVLLRKPYSDRVGFFR